MTVTEPTPLHPRSRSPFHQVVANILGPSVEADLVGQIVAAHDAELRRLSTQMDSYRRSEADAHAQHWTSWRMLEFVQSTASTQLRRSATMYARASQAGAALDNIRHLLEQAEGDGRAIAPVDLRALLPEVNPSAVLAPTILALVPDNSYATGVFEGNADGAPVTYRFPYYGVALVTTSTEPERITEPAFMVGERILTVTALGQQMGVTLKTYE